MNLDPQAETLNRVIRDQNEAVYDLLSARGKAIYFPKLGILSQSAEAKGKSINATIGIAKENDGSPMFLKSLAEPVQLPPAKVFPYAPSPGTPDIRAAWKEAILAKNPGLTASSFGQPVVTNALTHALSMAGYLFTGEGDRIVLPDFYWENYDLTFTVGYGAELDTFPTYTSENKFNVSGLREKLSEDPGKKIVLLNFPNNPTGYTPTPEEIQGIVQVLVEAAQRGNRLAVLIDDAYFGLVFEEGVYKKSIFSELCAAHENILAVKIDGPTKEDYVWGFRVGFITFGVKGGSPELYGALEAKAGGAVRGTISNSSHMAQSLLVNTWAHPGYGEEKAEKYNTLKERYQKIKDILEAHPEYGEYFTPLPFNSGYFMCVRLAKNDSAEPLRQKLLSDYSTGVIAFGRVVRLAFSSTPVEQLEKLFDNLYRAAKELS